MIRQILLLAIVGLIVGYCFQTIEGFDTISEKSAKFKQQSQHVGPTPAPDLLALEKPQPFHPLGNNGDLVSNTQSEPATTYIDIKNDGDDAYTEDDPRDLTWIASWSAADRYARRSQNCAVKYTDAGPDGTTIVTVSKSCEAGMPHTRPGDRIMIPDSIPEPLKAEIIAHELVHIYQRRHFDAWRLFYQRNWSFIIHDKPAASMPASLIEARRSNPDTFGVEWSCWMGRYWPVPIYTSPDQPSLRDAVTVWWDEWQHKILKTPPTQWTTFFGRPSQDEHPHEMAAVMIVAADTSSEAGRRLMNWWRTDGTLIRTKSVA